MHHIILGNGEVGKCISEIISGETLIFDKGEWEGGLPGLDENIILHICIPYSSQFIDIVRMAAAIIDYRVMIIHSTVKDGTCETIARQNILYSPVTGRHQDDFSQSVRQFKKFFAGERMLYDRISPYFEVKTEYWGLNRSELEYAKIMSTSYMYWNLIYEKVLYSCCQEKNYDHNKVYKRWNRNYNNGYAAHHDEWKRPVYEHVEDPTPGGHCLRPNIHLTDNQINEFIKTWEIQK